MAEKISIVLNWRLPWRTYQIGDWYLIGAIVALHLAQLLEVCNFLLVELFVSIRPLVVRQQLQQLIRHGQCALHVACTVREKQIIYLLFYNH